MRRAAGLIVVTGALVAPALPALPASSRAAAAWAGPAPGGTRARAATARAVTSGFNDWRCRPTPVHPDPVVILHGLGATWYEDTGMYLAPYLAGQGYCVFGLTYGATSILGPFVGGLGDIGASAQQIAAYVTRVLAATGAGQVDLVGHSEGAFESLYVPKEMGDAADIDRVVALAPPTHGTTFGGLVSLAGAFGIGGLVNGVLGGVGCVACTQLVTGGTAVAQLDQGPIAQPGVTYTVITSTHDELVTPVATAFVDEPGVTNETVQQYCPFDPVGHIGEAYDPDVARMVANALDPATAAPVACSIGLPF